MSILGQMSSRNRLLYVVALLLACACVLGGVLVVQARSDRADARTEQERYGDVLASARTETEAFINIDFREAQASIDKVAAGATGEFEKEYTESVESVIEVLELNESVMDGTVEWAGVVSLDRDSARVIAATTGTVANKASQGKPVARNFRVVLDLELVDGEWLTSNLEFVG
jgi:Mce-associated membrane protein